MFNSSEKDLPSSKCYVTHGSLPLFVDPKHPPIKRKPFSTILNQPFNHKVGANFDIRKNSVADINFSGSAHLA